MILLLLMSSLCVLCNIAWAQPAPDTLYILPNQLLSCLSKDPSKCISLSHLPTRTILSHTVLRFLPGVHHLDNLLQFADIVNLTMIGEPGLDVSTIFCNRTSVSAGVMFMNISGLVLTEMTFVSCHVQMDQDELMITKYGSTFLNFTYPVNFGLYMNYVFDLEMSNVRVQNSTGYGLLAFNVLGNSQLDGVNFSNNNREMLSLIDKCFQIESLRCKGGNLLFVYTDLLSCPETQLRYSLSIKNSIFTKGLDLGISYMTFITPIKENNLQFITGAGLGVHMMQSSYGIDAVIENCTMHDNAAYVGANLYIAMWDYVDNSTILVRNSTMSNGSSPLEEAFATVGAYDVSMGFYYNYGLVAWGSYQTVCLPKRKYEIDVIRIEDCEIIYNRATLSSAGFVQGQPKTFLDHPRRVLLQSLRFIDNNGDATLVLWGGLGADIFTVRLIECEFIGNYYRRFGTSFISSSFHQVVYQISMQQVEYENCTWLDNRVTSLHAIQSVVTLIGRNNFINNSAIEGGGIKLQEGSEMFLREGSKTSFIQNHAKRFGGGLYTAMLSYRCFFQLDLNKEYPSMYFEGNTAGSAGNAVYGNIRVCLLDGALYTDTSFSIFNNISEFTELNTAKIATVSSTANRLCICINGTSTCNFNNEATFYNVTTSPGKIFSVPIEAFSFIGDRSIGGETPGGVNAEIIRSDSVSISIVDNITRQIPAGCSSVRYAVIGSENETIEIQLAPDSQSLYFPVYLRVQMEKCPIGFVYSEGTLQCECNSFFTNNNINCDLQTESFTKSSQQWIGIINEHVVAEGYCNPGLKYCSDTKNVTLSNTNTQCANNHDGVLCGSCKPGYSLTLGSSRCIKCSNKYLALFLVFIAAGPVLIVFLSFFDLTVKTGIINGILFYSNVIKLANPEFFNLNQPYFIIFEVIINWVNLDFGIVSCFYNGFDAYTKAWFNFAFPIYLFIILGVIAISAKRLSKYLPNNILPVITTVLLICFTKLLRSSVLALFPVFIDTADKTHIVWLLDGNIPFFGYKHAPLAIFSFFVLLLYIVPFTIILTFYPSLQSFTAHEDTVFEPFVCFFRRQIVRLKPLLETYDGPYLLKYRYYSGAQAILRIVILFVTVTFLNTSQPWLKFVTVSIICISLKGFVLFGKIYVYKLNVILELIYLGNIATVEFIFMIFQLLDVKETFQGVFLCIFIALSLIVFVCAVIYDRFSVYRQKMLKCFGKESSLKALKEIAASTNLDDSQDFHIITQMDENRRARMNRPILSEVRKKEQLIQRMISSSEEN